MRTIGWRVLKWGHAGGGSVVVKRLERKARLVAVAALAAVVLAIATGISLPAQARGSGSGDAVSGSGTCHVAGSLHVEFDPANPRQVAEASVGRDCQVSTRIRTLSQREYEALAGPAGEPPAIESLGATIRGRLVTKHFGLLMAQLDSFLTFSYDFSEVTSYGAGSYAVDTGGCGWHVTDGPYGWWETGEMPSKIYRYAWAYFESCSPTVEGWLEPAPYGTYSGGYGTVCDYDIVLPWLSTIQCLTTRIH